MGGKSRLENGASGSWDACVHLPEQTNSQQTTHHNWGRVPSRTPKIYPQPSNTSISKSNSNRPTASAPRTLSTFLGKENRQLENLLDSPHFRVILPQGLKVNFVSSLNAEHS